MYWFSPSHTRLCKCIHFQKFRLFFLSLLAMRKDRMSIKCTDLKFSIGQWKPSLCPFFPVLHQPACIWQISQRAKIWELLCWPFLLPLCICDVLSGHYLSLSNQRLLFWSLARLQNSNWAFCWSPVNNFAWKKFHQCSVHEKHIYLQFPVKSAHQFEPLIDQRSSCLFASMPRLDRCH